MVGQIKIPSDMSNIYRAEKLIDKLAKEINISDEVIGNISVCVVEAVSNAIQHGNKYDVTKITLLSYKYIDNIIEFTIKDEGKGFDLKHVPDPTLPENLENFKGRGIFLINHLADKVLFEDNGTMLTITFKI
ncbi:MAG: ATP-binding protein [Bacteroidales bacterium]|nr:ATP-binding protein [Bacteroidales bacterium]MBN2758182.1 ATP-binding protein [Bacteroidales bacterium]